MSRLVRIGLFASLALGVCLLSSSITRGDDDEEQEKMDIKEAGKATDSLKKLLEAIEKDKDKKDIVKCAEDLNKKTDLKHIMWAAYKPREKGGLGVGDKANDIKPDGIEAKLINMSKKPMPEAQLAKEGPALIKIAEVAQSMAEIAELNTPKKNEPKKPIADWTKANQAQREAAKAFQDAVKAKNPEKLLDATKNLYGSCTNCHSVFRGDS
jgi:cytochrome c556